MQLHLYQDIPYIVIDEKLLSVDLFSPMVVLEYFHSCISSFAGNNYSCQEAAVFSKINPEDIPNRFVLCKIGCSITLDDSFTVPPQFTDDIFSAGKYIFIQFQDKSSEGIREAVKLLLDYQKRHNLQPTSDYIMLRMVREDGGIITNNLDEYAFQLCMELVL